VLCDLSNRVKEPAICLTIVGFNRYQLRSLQRGWASTQRTFFFSLWNLWMDNVLMCAVIELVRSCVGWRSHNTSMSWTPPRKTSSTLLSTRPFMVRILPLLPSTDYSGFLQVGKKSGNWSGRGKVRGKYFLEKSGKMKNCCHQMSDFQAKMHQIRFLLGLCPKPCWGSLQRSPRPPSCT